MFQLHRLVNESVQRIPFFRPAEMSIPEKLPSLRSILALLMFPWMQVSFYIIFQYDYTLEALHDSLLRMCLPILFLCQVETVAAIVVSSEIVNHLLFVVICAANNTLRIC